MSSRRSATLVATLLASVSSASSPTLEKSVGIGAGLGAQHYMGSFGDHTSLYGRGLVAYHPLEWLGTRATAGFGNLQSDSKSPPAFRTEWFFNVGADLVLQPVLWQAPVRPYLASGLSTTFGSAGRKDSKSLDDLDWNLYTPVELGLEVLIGESWSVWAFGESYLYMTKYSRLDGKTTGTGYSQQRDDWEKAGIGITYRFGGHSDRDEDGVDDKIDRCPSTPVIANVDSVGCPIDTDKDGVADFKDRCTATPSIAKVDTIGCPRDTDKDKIPDFKDKCPNSQAGERVDLNGCPPDSDKDGLPDATDKCPGTPDGVKVDDFGCAVDTDKDGVVDALDKCPATVAGTKVDARGCTVDSDKDGVADDKDICPSTILGAKVDASGCPFDADRDGVADDKDKCPNTKLGERIDSVGCQIIVIEKGTKLTLDGIVFKLGSAQIDAVSAPALKGAAAAIMLAPTAIIEIAGFTDNKGKEPANKSLSQKRADAVKAYLLKLKVPASQLTSKGYGSLEPVADNATEPGRAKNRRIEFRVK
ncbi:MAG: OmpA family protein [Fibrobacteres bacterium]|nr:OmpA family protein [Fibrobacterota bacterium]